MTELLFKYVDRFILPEEVSEGEKRKVVVGALKTGETRDYYLSQEEFLDVLDHNV